MAPTNEGLMVVRSWGRWALMEGQAALGVDSCTHPFRFSPSRMQHEQPLRCTRTHAFEAQCKARACSTAMQQYACWCCG